jgi:hypothetical protein
MGEDTKKREVVGWTMIIILVLCLLLVAIAIGFPIWGMISGRVKVNATDALVRAVATAITTYQIKTWTWNEGTTSEPIMRSYHLFDLNHDNQIDGYAAVTASPTLDGGFPTAVIASGYTGFVDMAKPHIKKSFISPQGIPIDAWGRSLRIAFAAKVYGTQAFGVWSVGPDGVNGTADDLQSWTPVPTPAP